MSTRKLIIVASLGVLIVATAGWYWRRTKQIEWYGGVKPFMQKLHSLHEETAAELARSQKLPEDYEQMEQLSQDAQDLMAVFVKWKDPRQQDPRFGPLTVEVVRQATMLEHDWDNGTREQAMKSFKALTTACNNCHAQLAVGKPPKLTSAP